MTILEVKHLKKSFPQRESLFRTAWIRAVEGVSFTLEQGKTLAIVGESGSGKTTVARMIAGLLPPDSGEIRLWGQSLWQQDVARRRQLLRRLSIVYQNPTSSLNPRMTVGDIVAEPLDAFRIGSKRTRQEKVEQMMEAVGLRPEHLTRYPHELSGGQRQRVAIARALVADPELIILDEPTSALDVSVQAQILNILIERQKTSNISYLFISHDLGVVRYMSDTIAVMHRGKLVEFNTRDALFANPQHEYTQTLLASVPDPFLSEWPRLQFA